MRGTIPISVEQGARRFSRWDALAILLTLGVLIFIAEASRHLLQPLAELQVAPCNCTEAAQPERDLSQRGEATWPSRDEDGL